MHIIAVMTEKSRLSYAKKFPYFLGVGEFTSYLEFLRSVPFRLNYCVLNILQIYPTKMFSTVLYDLNLDLSPVEGWKCFSVVGVVRTVRC